MSVANHRAPFRPLRGGTQIFQPDHNEAGTIGTFLTSNGVDRWLLTAFHVVARSNGTIVAADRIVQPTVTQGVIATLGTVVFDVGLDCAAISLAVPVVDEVLGIGTLAPAVAPAAGMRVIKSGWKTGVSEGRIQAVAGNDVVIERLPGYPVEYLLAARGDSGAVWLDAATFAPVALHSQESAVGVHRAIAKDFTAVLGALQLQQT